MVIQVKATVMVPSKSDNDRVYKGKTVRKTKLSTGVNKSVYEE